MNHGIWKEYRGSNLFLGQKAGVFDKDYKQVESVSTL